ncbi:hypothetical protein CAC42_7535 [Sphaceloma murrayae]|uniref:Uncharacterized protein n=1 Tax=Sphaceloma murrayae TaxID=2082308 RepID=A0A2K1QXA9_9PEZI|nr:hypothetical protein CAC42_7535 [Sphaceloma murrayae]
MPPKLVKQGYRAIERDLRQLAETNTEIVDDLIDEMLQENLDDLAKTSGFQLESPARVQLNLSRNISIPDHKFDKETVLLLAQRYCADAELATDLATVASVLDLPESIAALSRNAIREMLNGYTEDYAISSELILRDAFECGDLELGLQIWYERLVQEFADICPHPNAFELEMLADACCTTDQTIIEWCKNDAL